MRNCIKKKSEWFCSIKHSPKISYLNSNDSESLIRGEKKDNDRKRKKSIDFLFVLYLVNKQRILKILKIPSCN